MISPDPDGPPAPQPARPGFDLPGAQAIVGRGFDLSLAASGQVRRASVYIGLLMVAVIGPVVTLGAVLAATAPADMDAVFDQLDAWSVAAQPAALTGVGADWIAAVSLLAILVLGALLGLVALAIEGPIVGVAILAGQLVGRPMTLRDALTRSRQTFWRVCWAGALVTVPIQGVQALVSNGLAATHIPGEGVALIALLVSTLVGVPFGYLTTGIVVGDVGPSEAIRRSVRLARTRWRLAFVIAVFPAIFSSVQVLGLAAGGDIVVRIADAAGLGFQADLAHGAATLVVILAASAAVGSLVVTMSALLAAPQVVAFVGLTHYHAGLDLARQPAPAAAEAPAPAQPVPAPAAAQTVDDDLTAQPGGGGLLPAPAGAWTADAVPDRFRWVTRPMAAGIIVMAALALIGVAVLLLP